MGQGPNSLRLCPKPFVIWPLPTSSPEPGHYTAAVTHRFQETERCLCFRMYCLLPRILHTSLPAWKTHVQAHLSGSRPHLFFPPFNVNYFLFRATALLCKELHHCTGPVFAYRIFLSYQAMDNWREDPLCHFSIPRIQKILVELHFGFRKYQLYKRQFGKGIKS